MAELHEIAERHQARLAGRARHQQGRHPRRAGRARLRRDLDPATGRARHSAADRDRCAGAAERARAVGCVDRCHHDRVFVRVNGALSVSRTSRAVPVEIGGQRCACPTSPTCTPATRTRRRSDDASQRRAGAGDRRDDGKQRQHPGRSARTSTRGWRRCSRPPCRLGVTIEKYADQPQVVGRVGVGVRALVPRGAGHRAGGVAAVPRLAHRRRRGGVGAAGAGAGRDRDARCAAGRSTASRSAR